MIAAPPWATQQWIGVEDRAALAKDTGRPDELAAMMDWQAP